MLEEVLKQLVAEKKQLGLSPILIRNFLKEYIQYLVLYLIYNQKKYENLVFKGGSCLRIIYQLPRLSEDLDFDYDERKMEKNLIEKLANFLKTEISKKYYSDIEIKTQGDFRINLKFPILKNIGLSTETEKLFVKLELSNKISPYANFDITPISKYGFNFIIKSYDQSSLMSGKINALLFRIWYKGKENEIDIKGRDFYDIFWFFDKGVEPNWPMLKKTIGVKDKKQIIELIRQRINKSVSPKKLAYDLENFIADKQFVKNFSENYIKLMEKYLKNF